MGYNDCFEIGWDNKVVRFDGLPIHVQYGIWTAVSRGLQDPHRTGSNASTVAELQN